jgi:hypothetical protein
MLIAGRLAGAHQNNYVDQAAARRDAKAQLLQALYEGAVHSEGVSWEVVPQKYEPPSIEYDQWIPIDRGIWSHERCAESDKIYRLDSIEVNWDRDEISYFNSDGYWAECGERKIGLCCADLYREFAVEETTTGDCVHPDVPTKPPYRTGAAGRPSPKYLAEQEMQRRADQRSLCLGIGAEMRELCNWLKKEHPQAPPVTPRALENSLRHRYRALKRSMNARGDDEAVQSVRGAANGKSPQ